MKAWKMGFDKCENISFGMIKRRSFQNFIKYYEEYHWDHCGSKSFWSVTSVWSHSDPCSPPHLPGTHCPHKDLPLSVWFGSGGSWGRFVCSLSFYSVLSWFLLLYSENINSRSKGKHPLSTCEWRGVSTVWEKQVWELNYFVKYYMIKQFNMYKH